MVPPLLSALPTLAASALLLLLALLPLSAPNNDGGDSSRGGGVGVGAQSIESVSSYESCQVSATALPATAALANLTCNETTGFTSVILNMKPGTGGGDLFQVNLAQRNASQQRIVNGAGGSGAGGFDGLTYAPTDIVVEMGAVTVEYRTRRLRPIPDRVIQVSANGGSCRIPQGERPFPAFFTTPDDTPEEIDDAASASDSCARHYCCFGECFCKACVGAVRRFERAVLPEYTGGSQIPQCLASDLLPSAASVAFPYELAMTSGPIVADAGPAIQALGGGAGSYAARCSNGTANCAVTETKRVCTALRMTVCLSRPGPARQVGVATDLIMYWAMPIWQVFEIEPLPVLRYTVRATVSAADGSGTPPQVIELGVVEVANTSIAANSVYNATTQTVTSFQLAGRSQDGRVTLTLLSQSVFGTLPAQEGLLVAIDDEWRPGTLLTNQQITLPNGTQIIGTRHVARAGYFGLGYDEGPTLPTARAAVQYPVPPAKWFWARNRRDDFFVGPNCNEQGMTNDYWAQGGNADLPASRGLIGTCVPSIDTWSSPGQFARNAADFPALNRDACQPDPATASSAAPTCLNTRTVPPFVPPLLWPRVWTSQGSLRYQPPANVVVAVRVQLLIDGTFARLVRRLPPGRLLAAANVTQACTLTVGVGGFLYVDVENTDTTFAGSYVVSLDCAGAPGYTVGVADVPLSLRPLERRRVDFGIFLSGPNTTGVSQCRVLLKDAENLALDVRGVSCNETLLLPAPTPTAPAPPNNSSQDILGPSVSEAGQIATIAIALALGACALLCCCCIYGRQLRSAGFIRRLAKQQRKAAGSLRAGARAAGAALAAGAPMHAAAASSLFAIDYSAAAASAAAATRNNNSNNGGAVRRRHTAAANAVVGAREQRQRQ